MTPLVSPQWLNSHLSEDKLILLDASMDKVVGKAPIVYETPTYIPNSLKLDLAGSFCNTQSDELHALPTQAQFEAACRDLGIVQDSLVVIYDNQGVYSAPRAWWTFKIMGFARVFVLDGGLPQWQREGYAVMDQLATPVTLPSNSQLLLSPNPTLVCDAEYVLQRLHQEEVAILDARSAQRFTGTAPEPRPGVRSGHIPGSLNLPFTQVLDGYKLKSQGELNQLFHGLTLEDKQVICSCGSGITACILLLAAEVAGVKTKRLYDGSWADWGSKGHLPVETD